jgi:hypothetical protein
MWQAPQLRECGNKDDCHRNWSGTLGGMKIEQAHQIASLFDLPRPIEVYDFPLKGNINKNAYSIVIGSPADRREYILQQLNPDVFTQPRAVMSAMILCLEEQQKAVAEGSLRNGEEWEPIRLIPTREGKPYLEICDGEISGCWRVMARIGNAQSFRSLQEIQDRRDRLKVAEEAGRGLALFGRLTSGMDSTRIGCPLPGYRDTNIYYSQLSSVLAGHRTLVEASHLLPADPIVRKSTEQHYLLHLPHEEYQRRLADPQLRRCIDLALEEKLFALKLVQALATGALKTVVVHGDTKLENYLFNAQTGQVKALVDMDTIMPHTWLSDWGDMMRSLVNPAGEKETDLNKVEADMEIFDAAAKGFLGSAIHLESRESAYLMDAVQILALELGVRFLADYVRGDSYFRLGPSDPPDLNKTRAMVQFRLFESLRSKAAGASRL